MRCRLLRRCLLFTLLGLVTAVVVAWGVSVRWQVQQRYPQHAARGVGVIDGIIVSVTAHRGPGLYREEWWLTDPATRGFTWPVAQNRGSDLLHRYVTGQPRPHEPDSSAESRRGDALAARGPRPRVTDVAGHETFVQSVQAGWPLLALRWTSRTDHDAPPPRPIARTTARYRMELPWGDAAAGSGAAFTGTIALPLEPRLGLAVNTLFYAVLWGLLLLAPGALRRRIRRAGGRCPKCGYSLRGQPEPGCPECGHGRQGPADAPCAHRDSSSASGCMPN